MLIWRVLLLVEPLAFFQVPFHSDYLYTVLSHELCISVTPESIFPKVLEALYQ